ncbi:NAD(P)H-dependent FMN reductase [Microbacteriaceae bacterium SG_E_30_P1]|uniref:NAD(P)H-dependent FMN reductase n=1 Tax=Antiquaquibacter oligotrophicus TaxID=2880260 RepID=A0ABT6KM30_9MICO|nr:NAD(P)H-dependent oxidoreductase [Antiquaquibacter oligotrophicus]MDH6180775.1 NAD(P)H-dependent FMN reductase [Antiquaquibacter oligotrophicus]UDF13506.1 NAD(P)H-dependent oxidoreductase [Antiquaquibacter oligotrophicus]
MSDLKIAVVVASTRPGRVGDQLAHWVLGQATTHGGADYHLVDLAELGLSRLDESIPAAMGAYENDHTKQWAALVADFDGFIFVTPEYNRSIPGSLKNAIDFVYSEWNNKAAGIVSYGGVVSGARAAEHLRGILAELQVASVRQQVMFSTGADFENYTTLKSPGESHVAALQTLLSQLVSWSAALKATRAAQVG